MPAAVHVCAHGCFDVDEMASRTHLSLEMKVVVIKEAKNHPGIANSVQPCRMF